MAEPHQPGAEAKARAVKAAAHALNVAAGHVLAEAVDRAPLEEGGLRESGHVSPEVGATHVGPTLEVEVAFDKPYAAAQHEAHGPPSWEGAERPFDYTEPGTGPKYLEGALLDNAPRLERAVKAAVDKAVGGG